MKTHTILLMTLLSSFATLSTAWGQAPPQPAKTNAAQPQAPHIIHFSTPDASDFILDSTGKSAVDKEAVKAREERDAEAYQAILEGEALFRAGKMQEAIASYNNALAIVPTDGLAYQRLAEADIVLGKLDEASQNFHKILVEGFGPHISTGVAGNQDVWAEYALVLLETKHEADALQAYNHAALIADYEIDQHDPSKLVPHLPVMFPEVAMSPDSPGQVQYTPECLLALVKTLHAYDEMSSGSNKEAIAYAKEAAKLYPNSAAVQYYLGEALSRSYYVYLDSAPKDKAAALAACQEDKKAVAPAYKKAAELGDDRTTAAAKERLAVASLRRRQQSSRNARS